MKRFIQQKAAFTLAEVLITLGIIGVVAAITMPTLIQNYKKTVYVNQLKKSVSMLEQGFKKMMADDGVDSLSATDTWAKMPGVNGCDYTEDFECSDFYDSLKKYFKIIATGDDDVNKYSDLNSSTSSNVRGNYLSFADGAMIMNSSFQHPRSNDIIVDCETIKSRGGHYCHLAGYINLDINGLKGPNKIGRDIFTFNLGDDGRLYPEFGKDFALAEDDSDIESNGSYWRNDEQFCGAPGEPVSELSSGIGCAARIIDSGWVMDY